MFKVGLNKPSILFSKTPNPSKIVSIHPDKNQDEKIKIIPKVFQKGSFKISATSNFRK